MWPYTQINVIAGLIRQPVNLGGGRGGQEVSKAKRPPVCVAPTITASFHLPLCPFFGADELPGYCVSGVISKQPPPGGHSGGLQGLALIARRHCSRIPRAKHIDALIRPSLLSFCSAKHNLWLPDKSVRNNRRLTINGGTCQGFFSSFFSHLVPKNFSPLA